VPHEPLARAHGRCVRVVGAEEDLLAPRVQQLGNFVELFRPGDLKDVLSSLSTRSVPSGPLLNSHTGRAASSLRCRRENVTAGFSQWNM
jgi:hypothetical protein